MRNTPLRLVVVDDHALFRRGLISLLGDMREFKVVGEAEKVEKLCCHPRSITRLVLLDVNMRDGWNSNVEALRKANCAAYPYAHHIQRKMI